ncbi:hypothetical protein DIPPA_29142 [Diplonema papillatum]|nr:hypothetical protein DIPPA_29142 [Diplonema papillatum]
MAATLARRADEVRKPANCEMCAISFHPCRRGHTCWKCKRFLCSGCARVRRGPSAGGAAGRVCTPCAEHADLLQWSGWLGPESDGVQAIREFNKCIPRAADSGSSASGSSSSSSGSGSSTEAGGGAPAKSAPLVTRQRDEALLGAVRSIDPSLPPLDSPSAYLAHLQAFLSSNPNLDTLAQSTLQLPPSPP